MAQYILDHMLTLPGPADGMMNRVEKGKVEKSKVEKNGVRV